MLSRKVTTAFILLSFLFAIAVFVSCKKTETASEQNDYTAYLNLPDQPFNYAAQALPAHLQVTVLPQDNNPASNPVTDWGATLGRVLFYDKNISINNAVACASCHSQQRAFGDALAFSKGFANGLTTRNSMSLVNARYYPNGRFFWDQRSATLEIQTLQPIQHPVEMGMNLDTMVKKLQALPYYGTLFTKTFGDKTVTSDRVSRALSQFIRSIISYQSKYDVGRAAFPPNQGPGAVNFTNFTAEENRGKQIFFGPVGNCAQCHGTETFTAAGPKNNGLELVSVDRGVGGVNNNPATDGLFKVTSLKNIELAAPYMHDGRFTTLEQVVEHYSSGVQAHPNLAPELKLPTGLPKNANFTVADKAALVAFLKTLTDNAISVDVKFSSPFK
jgi:cytochrome c peroxidase